MATRVTRLRDASGTPVATPARRRGQNTSPGNAGESPAQVVESVETAGASNAVDTPTTTTPRANITSLPPYEQPVAPLTPQAAEQLRQLFTQYPINSITDAIDYAHQQIQQRAGDINEHMYDLSNNRKRPRPQEEGAAAETEDEGLEALRVKVDNVTDRLDAATRKMIDCEAHVAAVKNAHEQLQREAGAAAATAASQAQTQTQSQSQTQASTTQRSVTLDPATTQQDVEEAQPETQPAPALKEIFEQRLQQRADAYTAIPLRNRYGTHNKYVEFKRGVHMVRHDPNAQPPLPHASTWFPAEAAPEPGVTNPDGAPDDAAASSDEDIAIARERTSTRCPLTLLEFSDPVTSAKCPHSFEKSAIEALIRQQPRARGVAQTVRCPVAGCAEELALDDVARDPVMVRRIRRIQRAREMLAEDGDGGGEAGTGAGPGGAEEIESDSGDDIDDVDGRMATPAVSVSRVKSEPRRTRRGGRDEIED